MYVNCNIIMLGIVDYLCHLTCDPDETIPPKVAVGMITSDSNETFSL